MKKKFLSLSLVFLFSLMVLPEKISAAVHEFNAGHFFVTVEPSTTPGKLKVTHDFDPNATPAVSTTEIDQNDTIKIVGYIHGDVTQTPNHQIIVKDGVTANILLSNLYSDLSKFDNTSPFTIEGNSKVNLTLEGENTLISGKNAPAISVPIGNELIINGYGKLNVSNIINSAEGAAAIGSKAQQDCGTITINGGTIVATVVVGGAAIGSGIYGKAGTINITGGIINASVEGIIYSGMVFYVSSAIGNASYGSGGIINISGGTINAKTASYNGTVKADSIGNAYQSTGAVVKITGGSIKVNDSIANPTSDGSTPVYKNTLKVGTIGANKNITSGSLDGVIMRNIADPVLGVYGINDVQTDNDGKIHLWLPENNSSNAHVKVNTSGLEYSKEYSRNTAEQTHTLLTTAIDITFPNASNITYGQTLASSNLTSGTTSRGTFSWINATDVLLTGVHNRTVEFTPNDLDNYDYSSITGWDSLTQTIKRDIQVTVNKAENILNITCPDITYGDALTPVISNLSGGSETIEYKVKGALDSTYTTIKPTDAGDYTIKVSTASTTNYNAKEETLDFKILKANVVSVDGTVTKMVAPNTILSQITIKNNGGIGINNEQLTGTFSWKIPTTQVANTDDYMAVFTPDSTNYNTFDILINIKVDGDGPVISDIKATSIGSDKAKLEVIATDDSQPLSYQWQVKGSWIDIPKATTAQYEYTNLKANTQYTVRVIVSDSLGNKTTSQEVSFKTNKLSDTSKKPNETLLARSGSEYGILALLFIAIGGIGIAGRKYLNANH